jgi:hypothetical protein
MPITPNRAPLRSSHFTLPVRPPCFVTVTLLDTPVRSIIFSSRLQTPDSRLGTPLVSSKSKCAPPSPTPPPASPRLLPRNPFRDVYLRGKFRKIRNPQSAIRNRDTPPCSVKKQYLHTPLFPHGKNHRIHHSSFIIPPAPRLGTPLVSSKWITAPPEFSGHPSSAQFPRNPLRNSYLRRKFRKIRNPQSAIRNQDPPLNRQKLRAPALFLSSSLPPSATILRHRGSMN